ncbi:MAG TPA: LytTR family DNA-binding domain-containing protein [Gemmatimonadaceae bacterium]|nr:LytTR family DNA-binding domain-containing protein [Gemmatimonadaceae bacterium]
MSAELRVLVVDDEPLATRRLRRMLATHPDVTIVAECSSGAEALEAFAREAPDLLLLDVQMPDGDGFEVLEGLGRSSSALVVFVTAFDEYAVRAFEAAALDYLVKPVRRARLDATLDRARERLALRAAATPDAVGHVAEPSASAAEPPSQVADRLQIDRGRHMDVVMVDDIDWVESADNDVIVHIGSERHRYRRTMEQVLARLPATRFVRVHRSAIVNLGRVRQVHPWFHGNYLLVLADGTRMTTGRTYREQFLERIDALR